jgi:hypothetical protein
MKKKTFKFQSKREPPWPSNNFETRRMKQKEREFTINANVGLAQFGVWNQKNEKKNSKISIKGGATLAQQQLQNQKDETKGT